MSEQNNIVEDIERVELPGSNDGDDTVDKDDADEGTESESEEGEAPKDDKPQPKEKLVVKKPDVPAAGTEDAGTDAGGNEGDKDGNDTGPKPVEGETPRERALRIKVNTLEAAERRRMGGDLNIGKDAPKPAKREISPERAAVLSKYKPEEIAALREVLPAIAEEMGYVSSEQLGQQQYAERSEDELENFLKEHKEYLPENDKEGVLWNVFKEHFSIYKPPQNPKEYRKIFNRIHTDIFGIKAAGDKGAIIAQQRKITVASHAGASGPSRTTVSSRPKAGTNGLRMDMLQGFSDEEKAEMTGED